MARKRFGEDEDFEIEDEGPAEDDLATDHGNAHLMERPKRRRR